MQRSTRARAIHAAAHACVASALVGEAAFEASNLGPDGQFNIRIGTAQGRLRVALAGCCAEFMHTGLSITSESDLEAIGDALDELARSNRSQRVEILRAARREVSQLLLACWSVVVKIADAIEDKIDEGVPFPCPCLNSEHTGDKNDA